MPDKQTDKEKTLKGFRQLTSPSEDPLTQEEVIEIHIETRGLFPTHTLQTVSTRITPWSQKNKKQKKENTFCYVPRIFYSIPVRIHTNSIAFALLQELGIQVKSLDI